MGKSVGPNHTAVVRQHRASLLGWAARLLSLGYGLLISLYALGAMIMTLIGNVSRSETWGVAHWLLSGVPFFVPLALALIAWRWHLLGGTLLAAGGVALHFFFFAVSDHMQWAMHLYISPLLTGGLLHLLAWCNENWTYRTPEAT